MKLYYPYKAPVLTQINALQLGIRIEGATGDVDLEITGDEIDTINQTITAQQADDGHSIFIYSNSDGYRNAFTITVTASGGAVAVEYFTAYVSVDTENTTTQWTSYMTLVDGYTTFVREFPTWEYSEIGTIRQALKDQIYVSGLPSSTPEQNTLFDLVNFPTQGVNIAFGHANADVGRHLIFGIYDLDGYSFSGDVGWVTNVNTSFTLVIDLFGHGEVGHLNMYTAIMDAGYDYANANLPALTNNPAVLADSNWASKHDALLSEGVDRDGFDARIIFVQDKVRFIDWVLTQKAYTKVIVIGVSGGGLMAGYIGALEPRVKKTFNCRGAFARCGNGSPSANEFEYAPNGYFDWYEETLAGPRQAANLRAIDRMTHWMLCAHDGREYHYMTHFLDSGGYTWQQFTPTLQAFAEGLGGSFNQVMFTDPATKVHGYQSDDINYLLANI